MRDCTLDQMRSFAAADNAWSVLCRGFEANFPGSKFILITRDPNSWYASACEHFGKVRSRMREWIYGVASHKGKRAAYVERLTRHACEVRAQTADCPMDFMEFDRSLGDGWNKIDDLLGNPVPRRAFPQFNTAAMRE